MFNDDAKEIGFPFETFDSLAISREAEDEIFVHQKHVVVLALLG